MDKTLKNMINNTIEREFRSMMEDYTSHLSKNPQLVEDDNYNNDRLTKVRDELYRILPKEKHHLVSEFEEASILLVGIEARVAFKEGLILGLTELSYLSEVGQGIAFI